MKLSVIYKPGSETFKWDLHDGPDGIDHHQGECKTLGECFEQILTSRIVISIDYVGPQGSYDQ